MKNTWIVIPAYNEETTLPKVIKSLKDDGYHKILVVDDGSTDNTYKIAKELAKVAVRHEINRGLGGALGTGIEGAVRLGAEYIVTFDADGQHDPEDLKKLLNKQGLEAE